MSQENKMENEVARAIVLEDVLKERERQDSMYGDQKPILMNIGMS